MASKSTTNTSQESSRQHQPGPARHSRERARGDVSCLYEGWKAPVHRKLGEDIGGGFIAAHKSLSRKDGVVPESASALVASHAKRIALKERIRAARHTELSDEETSVMPQFETTIDWKRCLRIVRDAVEGRRAELLQLLAGEAAAAEWTAYETNANILPNTRHQRVSELRKYLARVLRKSGMGDVVDLLMSEACDERKQRTTH